MIWVKQQVRNHAPLRKHQQNGASESSSRPAVKDFAMGWRLKVKSSMMVFYKDEAIEYEFVVPKKENLDGIRSERYLPLPLWMFVFSWFPWPVCSPLGFPVWLVVLLRIQKFRDPNLLIHTSNSLCVVPCFFFILSPSQDLMHCTLSITVGLCTPCQKSKLHQHNRFFFAGPWPLRSCL